MERSARLDTGRRRLACSRSGKVKLHVDDLPQVFEADRGTDPAAKTSVKLPTSYWGTLDKGGETEQFQFEANAGQTIVFDLAGKSLDSKIKAVVTLTDARGEQLATNRGFDDGDPLFAFKILADGRYTVRVADRLLGGSSEHFFRLSVGAFAYVTDFFPLSVNAQRESEVQLIGFNLSEKATVTVKAGASGEIELPIEADKFRARRVLKAVVSELNGVVEIEPNDSPSAAMPLPAPGAVNARISAADRAHTITT